MANNFATTAGDGTGKTFLSFQSAGGIDLPGGGVVFLTATTDGASTWTPPIAAALADDTANPTTILHGACGMVFNGSNWDRMPGTSAAGTLVNLGANNDVTMAVLPDTAGGALAALVVDAAAIETLLTQIDTDTGGIATSTASIDGKITACNTGAVVVSSSALPTGASTAANQPALGTAGTASSDVITIQGIASMTAIAVSDNSGSLTVDLPAVATGGATPGKLVSAASTNATSVKGSAGTLYSLTAMTTDATPVYLKLYNKASAPTVGTDTPVQVFMLPGNATGAGCVIPIPTCGIEFATGIAFALTTGAADSDTGAVAANEVVVSYSYK